MMLWLLWLPSAAQVQTGVESRNVPGRYGHCAVSFADHMITYGGRGFEQGSNALSTLGDAWAFSYADDLWTRLYDAKNTKDGPNPRSGHVCALVNDVGQGADRTAHMLVFGGMAKSRATDPASLVNEVWRLNLRSAGGVISATWLRLQPSGGALPVPRFDHTAVPYENGMLIYGGCESSTAFLDVWLLAPDPACGGPTPGASSSGAVDDASCLASSYTWEPLHLDFSPPPVAPVPSAPPSAPLGNMTLSPSPSLPPPANLSPPPPLPLPPPPLPFWTSKVPTPGARCAHAAVPVKGGMIVFGGRIPVPPASRTSSRSGSGEPTWLTLTDGWVFSVARARALKLGKGGGYPSGWWNLPVQTTRNGQTASAEVNRSDHTAVMRDGRLMLFGGLFTNIEENTIYIMKDWLDIDLPAALKAEGADVASPADQLQVGSLDRLKWGPAWRFLHTMVIASSIAHPKHDASSKVLTNAPLLYGGGGGMEIFSDLWVYDHTDGEWYALASTEPPTTKVSIVTSLLFGTVGFGLYACVIVCVFIRRISRTRRNYGSWPGAPGAPGGPAAVAATGGRRRPGAPADVIAALPRIAYNDMVKQTNGECEDSPGRCGSAADASSAAAGGGGAAPSGDGVGGDALSRGDASERGGPPSKRVLTADEEEGELCSVCLCVYENDDVLIRLPCDHTFHEACVTRWLLQDSSCPQCRFNLVAPPPEPRAHVSGGYDGTSAADVEGGLEMAGRPIARSGATAVAAAVAVAVPPAAVAPAAAAADESMGTRDSDGVEREA